MHSELTSKFLVYALVDPRNGEIRYIGKSSSGLKRPKHHFAKSVRLKHQLPIYSWINKLLKMGLVPTIEILEETDKKTLPFVEMYYIKISKKDGDRLLNLTEGGDGPTGRPMSQETKERISKANKGNKPKETINAARVSQTGKIPTKEQRQKSTLNNPKRKMVLCVETGVVYIGIRQAAKILNLDHRGIGRCCSGEYKQYKGFTWKFMPNQEAKKELALRNQS